MPIILAEQVEDTLNTRIKLILARYKTDIITVNKIKQQIIKSRSIFSLNKAIIIQTQIQ